MLMLRLKSLPQVVDKNLPIIKITTICCEIKETKSQKNATQMKKILISMMVLAMTSVAFAVDWQTQKGYRGDLN